MNQILMIEEVFNYEKEKTSWGCDGWHVSTEKEDYYILIDNFQCCCEDWGYFSSEDDVKQFILADLISVELTDTSLKTEAIEEIEYLDCGGVQFVTFNTNKGPFQLAVYNGHNGYYGHSIYVYKDDEVLLESSL